MGVLGGILLAIATILFFLGLSPIAIFVGIVGGIFLLMSENGSGAAKGYVGCGCLVVVILAVGFYLFFVKPNMNDGSSTSSSSKIETRQEGSLSWGHLDDGGFWVSAMGGFKNIDDNGDCDVAYLTCRRSRNKNGSLRHEVYINYCSKIVPNSVNEIAYKFSATNFIANNDAKWLFQSCSASTDNTAIFFNDNTPNDDRDDVVNLLNAMNGKRYFAACFKDHRDRMIIAVFDITGAFAKYIDLQEGVE